MYKKIPTTCLVGIFFNAGVRWVVLQVCYDDDVAYFFLLSALDTTENYAELVVSDEKVALGASVW